MDEIGVKTRKKRIEEQKEEEGKRRRFIEQRRQNKNAQYCSRQNELGDGCSKSGFESSQFANPYEQYVLSQKPSFFISSNRIVGYIQTLKDLLELLWCPPEIDAAPKKKIEKIIFRCLNLQFAKPVEF